MGILKRDKEKNFGNGLLNFAYNYPLVGVLVLPILFDWPAKALQAAVRTAKHGDPRLGAGPVAFDLEDSNDGMMGLSLFGSYIKQGGHFDEGAQFPPRGDMYRDTSHLTSHKTGPMYGESGLYRSTAHLAPSKPTPGAFSEGFLDAKGKGPKPDTRPSYSKADQQMVDLISDGTVFAGITGLGRIRR